MKISIPWGSHENLEFELPADWRLIANAAVKDAAAVPDLNFALRSALQHPVGGSPLTGRDLSGKKIAIVAEDGTRPAPTGQMLDVLLGEIFAAGGQSRDIVLLPGLGVHRPMTGSELQAKYGEAAAMLRVVQPDATDPAQFRRLGSLGPGIPLELHAEVCEADLVILVGTTEPHIQAGFGGGSKMLVPGVASAACIGRMHLLGSPRQLVQFSGQNPAENPMRRAIDGTASFLKGEVILLNVVLNSRMEVCAAYAGEVIAAHRRAAQRAAEIYGIPVPEPADVVISGSHPMDRDMRQGVKCFGGPLFAVRPGGVLIAAMYNAEGLGDYRPPFSRPLPKALVRLLVRLPGIRTLLRLLAGRGRSLNPENLHMVFYALQMVRRCRVIVYSPGISDREAKLFPLFDFASSMNEALSMSESCLSTGNPKVAVFPNGAISYPVIGNGAERD